MINWTKDTMIASTRFGLTPIPVMRLGLLAAHCMFADDGSGLDPENGYTISFFPRGLRMSYDGRVWSHLGGAMIFAENLPDLNWGAWHGRGPVDPTLATAFRNEQERLQWLLKPHLCVLPHGR